MPYAASLAVIQHYLPLLSQNMRYAQRRVYMPEMSYPVNTGNSTTQTAQKQHNPPPIPKTPVVLRWQGRGAARQRKRAVRKTPKSAGCYNLFECPVV